MVAAAINRDGSQGFAGGPIHDSNALLGRYQHVLVDGDGGADGIFYHVIHCEVARLEEIEPGAIKPGHMVRQVRGCRGERRGACIDVWRGLCRSRVQLFALIVIGLDRGVRSWAVDGGGLLSHSDKPGAVGGYVHIGSDIGLTGIIRGGVLETQPSGARFIGAGLGQCQILGTGKGGANGAVFMRLLVWLLLSFHVTVFHGAHHIGAPQINPVGGDRSYPVIGGNGYYFL